MIRGQTQLLARERAARYRWHRRPLARGKIVVPTTSDALVGEERTSEQPAIIRRAAAPVVSVAARFPAAVTDPLRDTPERCKS